MPRSRIAARNTAVLLPGSPNASAASGSGSPSVCARSYLEILQPGHGNAAAVAERGRHLHGPNSRCPLRRVSNRIPASVQETLAGSGSRNLPVNPAALIRTDARKTNAGHMVLALAGSDERHAPSRCTHQRQNCTPFSVSRCPPLPHLDYFGPLKNSAQARRRRCSPRVVTRVEARPSDARAPRDMQVSSWRPAPRSTADLPRSTA